MKPFTKLVLYSSRFLNPNFKIILASWGVHHVVVIPATIGGLFIFVSEKFRFQEIMF